MLIDIKRKIIFIAGLKTASTSIENALAPLVDIRLVRSEWGKHDSVAQVERKFDWLFQREPIEKFFKWAVIRDPLDVMWSLFQSHKHEKFQSAPRLYTGDMNFETFLADWRRINRDQCRPQWERFADSEGNHAIDFLLPYDSLSHSINLLAPRYGVKKINLPRLNTSEPMGADLKERNLFRSKIEGEYSRDMLLLEDARKSTVADGRKFWPWVNL